uniref:Uncharacterized protein n=1 Tax=Setaria digitata TaxID=48799 RepID=A0A915PHY0_9BILA
MSLPPNKSVTHRQTYTTYTDIHGHTQADAETDCGKRWTKLQVDVDCLDGAVIERSRDRERERSEGVQFEFERLALATSLPGKRQEAEEVKR